MWCPNCKSEYREGITDCPVCQVPLTDQYPDQPPASAATEVMEPEFLMLFADRTELDMALDLLRQAEIPYLCRQPGAGESLRMLTGDNLLGTELYVDRNYTHRALRLLRHFDRDADEPFDEAALDAAFAEYMLENQAEAQSETAEAEEPASPEGYRLFWVFLGAFAFLALIAVAARFL